MQKISKQKVLELSDSNTIKQENQVVSKKRVTDHGEVYTTHKEVSAMLDLVKQETDRIESRFLEPACGTGNFLAEVLHRKLSVVEARYSKSQLEYERYSVLAMSSIYGIDILEDNVIACRTRLLDLFDKKYKNLYKGEAKEECTKSVKYILEKNIILGDALSLKTIDDMPKPIVFSEWSLINGSMIKRRDFCFNDLLAFGKSSTSSSQLLLSDLGDNVFLPNPTKEYPPVHFLKIAYAE